MTLEEVERYLIRQALGAARRQRQSQAAEALGLIAQRALPPLQQHGL